jgi:hypothetical protein
MKSSDRVLVVVLLACSLALLVPGLLAPVLTIRGVLTREGIAQVAPTMLERGLSDDTVKVLESMMNPGMLALLQMTGGDTRKIIIEKLAPQISASLQKSVAEVEVYQQTRSIFSVIVPFGKAALVAWSMFVENAAMRRRTLGFVEAIAKWSMADVFVVALFIAYLAAQASATPTQGPNAAPALIAFSAHFGAGFYWFAAYCIFSLASQQITVRLAKAPAAAAAVPEAVHRP